jgi:hypothetical protein
MSEPYRERPELTDAPDRGEVITVATYATTVEAEMSREYLKAHGVPASTHEASSFNPLLNVAAGGARLLIRASDEAQARYFLERAARTPTTSREDDDDETDVRCPRCELTYCFQENAFDNETQEDALTSPFLSLFTLPFASRRRRWRCHKCLYVWDDAAEGPKRATSLEPDDPRPVFRWRSHRAGAGLFAGLVLMFAVWGLAAAVGATGPLRWLAVGLGLVPVVMGYRLGRRSVTDVCSAPSCRAVLPPGDEECASCHGSIAGVIEFAHEHHAKAAELRRELRALRAADDETPASPAATPAAGTR